MLAEREWNGKGDVTDGDEAVEIGVLGKIVGGLTGHGDEPV